MIEQLVNEINGLLRDGYPYSALGIALTLPDICGNIAYGIFVRPRLVHTESVMDKLAIRCISLILLSTTSSIRYSNA